MAMEGVELAMALAHDPLLLLMDVTTTAGIPGELGVTPDAV